VVLEGRVKESDPLIECPFYPHARFACHREKGPKEVTGSDRARHQCPCEMVVAAQARRPASVAPKIARRYRCRGVGRDVVFPAGRAGRRRL